MNYSVEENLLSNLITHLAGFLPDSENHNIALNFMIENAVIHHTFSSPFSSSVQLELSQLRFT
jgi:hypothetical protein